MLHLKKMIGISLCFTSSAIAATLVNGAGATFPYPLYSKWFSEYQKVEPTVEMNYQSIGSGGGIRQFKEKTVDFGATDTPMTTEQLAQSPVPILHIPTVLGAVVITYQIPGVENGLKLSPSIVADLFLGKIEKWDDPRIKELNPQIQLPSRHVIIVHRSDGSGTTAIFTDYLSKISPEWKQRVGTGPAVRWPVGLGGKGNEGVSGLIKQTPGTLGYVELIYAKNNGLPYASIQNKSGKFVFPDLASVTASAQTMKDQIPEDFRVSLTDSAGKDAYPISSFTYLLIYQNMPKEKGEKIIGFLKWAMKEGQKYADSLYYAPLPKELVKKVESKISSVKLN